MSVNRIAWKRVQWLNREMGETFVHATADSSGGWGFRPLWHCIRHDGSALYVNPKTHDTAPADHDPISATQRLLTSREPRNDADQRWLTELDERSTQINQED